MHLAFNQKPIWMRTLIVLAGPISNLLFAVAAYWVIFMLGVTSLVPILGDVPQGSIAHNAGLKSGQEIVAVDNKITPTWEDIVIGLAGHAGDNKHVNITVQDIKTKQKTKHVLNLTNWSIENEQSLLRDLGLNPYDPFEPIVSEVMPGYPAQKADLKAGDKIISIDGTPIDNVNQILELLQDKADVTVQVTLERGDKTLDKDLTPGKKVLENGQTIGFIGIQFAPSFSMQELVRVQNYAMWPALKMAFTRTQEYSVLTLQFLVKMVTAKISWQHVSGPIAIAQYAGVTARAGIENFLGFLALVSISLGIINLLPIPVLDGGHLLFFALEMIRGKALSTRAINVALVFGIFVLSSVMLLALYNDALRLLH